MFKSISNCFLIGLIIAPVVAQQVIQVGVQQIAAGIVDDPEAIAFDNEGRMYTSNADGRIIVINRDGSNPVDFAQTGGRPLGLKFDANGNLIVADAYEGLLSINTAGEITVLSTEYGGVPFKLTDDLDIASDGMIYFSDASWVFDLAHCLDDGNQSNGRLLSYDPTTQLTTLLLDSLFFANGIAISPDESFLLVNETWRERVRRYWLSGPQEGETDIFANIGFIDNVYPDNITYNGDSLFWVSTYDGPIVAIDTSGAVLYQLEFDHTVLEANTSTIQYNDTLYLGSFEELFVGMTPLPGVITTIKPKNIDQIPSKYRLNQNYPNPFNPGTSISYNLPEQSEVILTVYDMRGREVSRLQKQVQPAGHYEIQWNGVDNSGNSVGTGIYFAQLQAGDYSKTIKMLYLK